MEPDKTSDPAVVEAERSAVVNDLLPSIKTLTLWQPWAWLLFHGKSIENRNWATAHRGPLAIHSARSRHPEDYKLAAAIAKGQGIVLPDPKSLLYGYVLGIVDVVDCIHHSDSPWFFGQYGWVIENSREFETPFQATGGRMFWYWHPPALAREALQQALPQRQSGTESASTDARACSIPNQEAPK
jgi:hypothetical protein